MKIPGKKIRYIYYLQNRGRTEIHNRQAGEYFSFIVKESK